MKILITGISGKLGRAVARHYVSLGHSVVGVDRRPWPDAPERVQMFKADLRKRPAEDVFRTQRPDVVVHMATVTHFSARADELYRINLKGTQAVFDYCHRYGVGQCIFVGRHTYYGASPDSPIYHTEHDPPGAISTYPELADLVAADLYAGSALWRYPEVNTSVLRICYTLGPTRHGTLASYLAGPRVPTVLGFDPLFQFMHELDVASAICAATSASLKGVYNVAGPQPLPLGVLIKKAGRQNWRIPEPLYESMTGHMGLIKLPSGAVNHIKFPVVVDDAEFREKTGFSHKFSEVRTVQSFRLAG